MPSQFVLPEIEDRVSASNLNYFGELETLPPIRTRLSFYKDVHAVYTEYRAFR